MFVIVCKVSNITSLCNRKKSAYFMYVFSTHNKIRSCKTRPSSFLNRKNLRQYCLCVKAKKSYLQIVIYVCKDINVTKGKCYFTNKISHDVTKFLIQNSNLLKPEFGGCLKLSKRSCLNFCKV